MIRRTIRNHSYQRGIDNGYQKNIRVREVKDRGAGSAVSPRVNMNEEDARAAPTPALAPPHKVQCRIIQCHLNVRKNHLKFKVGKRMAHFGKLKFISFKNSWHENEQWLFSASRAFFMKYYTTRCLSFENNYSLQMIMFHTGKVRLL